MENPTFASQQGKDLGIIDYHLYFNLNPKSFAG